MSNHNKVREFKIRNSTIMNFLIRNLFSSIQYNQGNLFTNQNSIYQVKDRFYEIKIFLACSE